MTPAERDLAIRTVIGEAANEPYLGKLGVAAVINNRVKDGGYGDGVRGVVLKPKQFEPWSTRRGELMGYDESHPAWADAAKAVDAAEAGEDPTQGATHFANVATVKARGDAAGKPGGWLSRMANATKIGRHTFGNADAGRGDGTVRTVDTGDDTGTPTKKRILPKLLGDGPDAAEGEAEGDDTGMAFAPDTKGSTGGGSAPPAAPPFSLANVIKAINEPPVDEKHAEMKNLLADMLAEGGFIPKDEPAKMGGTVYV